MVAGGMREAGYQYVNIDDCWHGVRDSIGFIQPDAQRFPSGMKALADYVHSKGLKIGLYSDAGWKTCGGHPGSRGYEFQDALQYARWGVDYLKYDWCNADSLKASGAYLTMRDALHRAGRPIVFSICEWGDNQPATWAPAMGHLWRTTGDITNCWDCELNHGSWSQWGALRILDKQKPLRKFAGPGHWKRPGHARSRERHDGNGGSRALGDDLSRRNANFDRTTYRVRDLWRARDAGTTPQPLAMTIPAHGAEFYRLRRN